jgi:hypothetical protein
MTRLNIYPYVGCKDTECDVVLIDNQVIYQYSENNKRIMGVCTNKLPDNISSQIERLSWGSRLKNNKVLNRLMSSSLRFEELYNFII